MVATHSANSGCCVHCTTLGPWVTTAFRVGSLPVCCSEELSVPADYFAAGLRGSQVLYKRVATS